jgi:hypothetical protein
MVAQPRWASGEKVLQLACWIADGVCSRGLELDHFLSQHVVDICLLDETHLRPGKSFWFANCVYHPTDWVAEEGGTAILVSRL